MKAFLVVASFVVLVVAMIKADHQAVGAGEGEGEDEEEHGGLSCEAKKGCCKDALECPGCCRPPYDNQCSNLKGVPLSFCEITGTYFFTGINLNTRSPTALLASIACPSLNIAGNYPEQCQGSIFPNSKINVTKPKGPLQFAPQLNTSQVNLIRFSSCGHVVFKINSPTGKFSPYAEPFLINAVILARNDAGLAVVACYAIYQAPVFLSFILSPTPYPNQWALGELEKALEPYYAYGPTSQLFTFNYKGCYPSLDQLKYEYYNPRVFPDIQQLIEITPSVISDAAQNVAPNPDISPSVISDAAQFLSKIL